MDSRLHCRGLTRAEVVCLAALLVVAFGMLMPAVQRVRAASRGTSCANNLRFIALATHNYHDTYGFFPTGMTRQYAGTLIRLLPFIEQDPLYSIFSEDKAYSLYWENPDNCPPTDPKGKVPRPPEVYGTELNVRTYLCPEGPQPDDTVTALWAVHYGVPDVDYRADDAMWDGFVYASNPARQIMGRSHYLGIGGDWRLEGRYRGIFGYNTRTRIANITDGTSNTVLFAETWGSSVDWNGVGGVPSGWSVASRANGYNWTAFGTCPNPTNPNCDWKNSYGLSFGTFGALHGKNGNLFNAAFGDGTVRTLRGDIPYRMWIAIGGMRDGDLTGPPDHEPEIAWTYTDG